MAAGEELDSESATFQSAGTDSKNARSPSRAVGPDLLAAIGRNCSTRVGLCSWVKAVMMADLEEIDTEDTGSLGLGASVEGRARPS